MSFQEASVSRAANRAQMLASIYLPGERLKILWFPYWALSL
ncbi:MAG: hypothetical protein ANABAC_1993 [Anaerolineae bacterium]|nr:MAG: hypothetical protein ANABAC_1993 [Anaerolineae bacterium]